MDVEDCSIIGPRGISALQVVARDTGAESAQSFSVCSDGEVLAVCGGEDDAAATARDFPLDQLMNLDPSLALLAGLPEGWVALRESATQDWVRSQAE